MSFSLCFYYYYYQELLGLEESDLPAVTPQKHVSRSLSLSLSLSLSDPALFFFFFLSFFFPFPLPHIHSSFPSRSYEAALRAVQAMITARETAEGGMSLRVRNFSRCARCMCVFSSAILDYLFCVNSICPVCRKTNFAHAAIISGVFFLLQYLYVQPVTVPSWLLLLCF